MKFGLSTDTSGATSVHKIANELDSIFPALASQFPSVEIEIFFVFAACQMGSAGSHRGAFRRRSPFSTWICVFQRTC